MINKTVGGHPLKRVPTHRASLTKRTTKNCLKYITSSLKTQNIASNKRNKNNKKDNRPQARSHIEMHFIFHNKNKITYKTAYTKQLCSRDI